MRRSLFLLVLLVIGPSAFASPNDEGRGYLAPVLARAESSASGSVEAGTFPIARSGWLSVINFSDDWHAPRMRKIDGEWKQVGIHEGTDIFAEPGTPIRSVVAGRIERIGWTFYSGWRVGVRDGDGRYWFYAHLSSYAPGLQVGNLVAAGQHLGDVGNTGYGAKPGHRDEFTYHLHIGIQQPDGRWTNPYPLMKRLYSAAVDAAR